MKAFIYTGGGVDPKRITEHPRSGDLRIAADAGYRNAKTLGEGVDLLLGDFDSYTDPLPEDIETLRVPTEKDFTDTQLAVETALARGADEIVIIGGLDGRLDHTMANLSILIDLFRRHVPAVITNGLNRVRYLENTGTLIAKSGFSYLSLIPAEDKVKGVSAEGCLYPLKNATLKRDTVGFSTSNQITGNCALITVRKGGLFLIESAS
ncbi:MAG: thiamine diphosphokinase [Clostridia bacterium]|nr:thiamine diphosphokinase [Clostridia bacterium]